MQVFASDTNSSLKSDEKFIDRAIEKSHEAKDKTGDKAGCIEGQIKYLDGKKEVLLKEHYCFDSVLKSISSVRKCLDKDSTEKECLVNMPGPYEMKLKEIQTERGSIGFNICNKLKGTPQFIEFWDGTSWVKTSRCIFNDGSYMDIAALNLKVKYVD